MFRAAILAIAPRVDAHVVPGDSLRRRVSSLLGNRAARIAMIPPGVDVLRFDAKRRDQEQVDGLRRGAKRVVGFVGRLARQKSIETLLASATTLLAAEPSTRILIVGDGPRRKLLESECRRLGIADAVTFVGYVGAVWHCYQAMDVLTLVSQYEGFGIVTLEAMAMKVPVVATAVTGVSDAITDRENGLLVPFDDPATLAGTILELFDDERLRRKLESGGLATVRAHSREAMAAAAEALYADLAGAKDVP